MSAWDDLRRSYRGLAAAFAEHMEDPDGRRVRDQVDALLADAKREIEKPLRAALWDAEEEARRQHEDCQEAERERESARRIAVELEQQNAEALAILAERDCRDENGVPQILAAVQRAVDVLRGDPKPSSYRTWREVRAEMRARLACSGGAAIDHDETGACDHGGQDCD